MASGHYTYIHLVCHIYVFMNSTDILTFVTFYHKYREIIYQLNIIGATYTTHTHFITKINKKALYIC